MRRRFLAASSAAVLMILGGCTSRVEPPLSTAENLDLQRYSGLWYEAARYENRFEKGCVGATAHYELEGETVRVTNSCYNADARMTAQAEGRARRAGGARDAKLEVTFFWPFYGDYWVLLLADDYRYSVVGDPSREYLWILSREPQLADTDRREILSRLPDLGYDPAPLYWTDPAIFLGPSHTADTDKKE